MSKRRSAILGIIGGLGPRATARLYLSLTHRAVAGPDGALPTLITYSVPITRAIEDAFVAGAVDDRAPEMRAIRGLLIEAVDVLMAAGAGRIVMPCNTLQDMLASICADRGVELVHMVDATARAVRDHGLDEVLVLATRATCQWDIYGRRLGQHGIRCVYPPPAVQRQVEQRIRAALDLDHGRGAERFAQTIEGLLRPGVGVVIGCTDLTGDLALPPDIPLFDALDCLADVVRARPTPPASRDALRRVG